MPALQPGERLGSYLVEGVLGRGGMAEVYQGTHVALERHVAIKVLNPAFNADPTFPLRFLREAKTVARLNHPNIITIYDFGEQGEVAYLVMELAPGGTFGSRAERFRTLQDVVEGLAPIAEALQYAHGAGVVHRDLKPDNVLINEQDRLLLADFGLARIASESLDVTEAGMILGTPLYMSPEQALGEAVDYRADIYSLGVMAYRLVTGRPPFDGQTFFSIVQQHLKSPPPSVRDLLPDAPPALDAAIRRAMAKQPHERFDSATAFVGKLRHAAAEAPDLLVGVAAVTRAAATARRVATTAAPAGPVGTVAVTAGESAVDLCPDCGTAFLPADQFCRGCGGRRASSGPAAGAEVEDGPTVVLPTAALLGADPAAGAAAAVRVLPAVERAGRPARGRRPSSFTRTQWLAFAATAVVVFFINLVGLWLTQAGRDASADNIAAGLTTYIFDHLRAFKSGMTTIALMLAGVAVYTMRNAIIDEHQLAPATYRRLRRWHRFVGYGALTIAVAVGLLTCIGIFGFGTSSPRSALHSTLGAILLVLLAAKIAVVRYFPAQRRYLKLLGEAVLVMFLLVFLTSTIPYLWELLTDNGGGYRYGG